MTDATTHFSDDLTTSVPAEVAEFAQVGDPNMTIYDGKGGLLCLDVTNGELRWFVDACRRLLTGTIPNGASAIKVRAADKCYLLNRHTTDDGATDLQIVNLFDPTERVSLTFDLAGLVSSLLEQTLPRYALM